MRWLVSGSAPVQRYPKFASESDDAVRVSYKAKIHRGRERVRKIGRTISAGGSDSTTHQSLLAEVDAHRGDELRVEASVRVLVEQAGLAHAGVAQHEELEQVIVVNVGCRHCASSSSAAPSLVAQRRILRWRRGIRRKGRRENQRHFELS